MTAVSENS